VAFCRIPNKKERTVIDLFQRHVHNIKETGNGQFIGLCPFHDDRTPSFSFNEEGAFFCHACEIKGNAVNFAKLVGESASNLPKVVVSKRKVNLWSMPLPLKESFIITAMDANDHLLLNYEKYTKGLCWHKSIVEKLWIGWDEGFTFPYINDLGQMVNIKWHKRKQVKGHANTFIYPYWQMVHKYKGNKTLYIVEGEKDCVSAICGGKQAISFNNGANTNVPKELVDIIKSKFNDIAVIFDQDDAGRKATLKITGMFNA